MSGRINKRGASIMKNNEWSDVGEKIRDTVQSAIDSQDFSQLNKSINNAINGALDGVRTGLKGGMKSSAIYEPQDSQKYKKYPNKDVRGNFRNANYSTVLTKKVGYDTSLFARYPVGRVAGPLMTALGFSLMGLFFILSLSMGLGAIFGGPSGLIIASAVLGVLGLSGLFTGVAGTGYLKRTKRFKKYIITLNGRGYCKIEELAARVGKSREFVTKDLKYMIQNRMFLEGHLDREQTCLIVTKEEYGHYLEAREEMERRKAAETAIAQKTNDSGLTQECQKILEEGNAYIRHIHACNEALPGEAISEKLSRLEEIMVRIFKRVEKNPEIAPELHKFMNYYLPTTTKLLDAYQEMDSQPAAGQNIVQTKIEIENTLDTINSAFEKLLDRFFQETAWDISSDISVMKTMFAQEGLTKGDFNMDSEQKQED